MDLFTNTKAAFTKWIVKSGVLQQSFVLIDVGVFGGEHVRWRALGDHLVVHGFDAIKEAIEELREQNRELPNKTFHWSAIGNEDGERTIFFKPSNPTNTSLYEVPDP